MSVEKVNFDEYSEQYQQYINASIGISGESVDYFDEMKRKLITEYVLAKYKPSRILDFGTGIGKISGNLAKSHPQCDFYGYDLSEDSVKLAQEQFNEVQNITWGTSLAEVSSIDLVIAINVFHHIHPNSRDRVLKELDSKLNNGGHLLIIEHNPWNPATRYAVSKCEFDQDAILLPSYEITRRMKHYNYSKVFLHYIVFFPKLFSSLRFLETHIKKVPLGAQYMCMLKKP